MTGALIALGLVVYNNDRHDRQETSRAIAVDLARSEYLAELASYENSRDEFNRCVQRVDGRSDLRGVLLGLADFLSDSAEIVGSVSTFLDDAYPALNATDCPAPVQPPVQPPVEE